MSIPRWNYKFAIENPVYFAHLFVAYYRNMLQTTVDEERFVAEKLSVPPPLPRILKEFTKAAIRTQPYDLLRWSVSYFQALSEGTEPPVKERLEFPPMETDSGLTPGYLKILHKQLTSGGRALESAVPVELLRSKWADVCLKDSALSDMLTLLEVKDEDSVVWSEFVAVAAGHISQSPLQTMVQVCETLTQEPEGASACVPLNVFAPLYELISRLDAAHVLGIGPAVDSDTQNAVLENLRSVAAEQAGNVTPRNLAHFSCPKLY